jgi:NitT/TauT family transport system substrate-binding protein
MKNLFGCLAYLTVGLFATTLMSLGQGAAQTIPGSTVKVGLQSGGTLAWVVYAISRYGIDKELGLNVQATTYASKDASRIALRSGAAQVVVDDFLEVTSLRQKGFPVSAVYPFSLLAGGLMVPTGSGINTVADLKGKTIGATSLSDKSLLLLRAYAIRKYNFDPIKDSKVVAVSSPLMEQFMGRGEIEAGFPFWHHGARMAAAGKYRQLISTGELLRGLNLPAKVPLLYFIARDDTNPAALRLFVKATQLAEERMKQDDAYWPAMLAQNLYALPDASQLPALRKQWEAGLPKSWSSADVASTLLLTRKLIEVAGPDVVGTTRLDTTAFNILFKP